MYWYENDNADRDIFVSSRVRLARNLADYPFEPTLEKTGAAEIIEKVRAALPEDAGYKFTDFSALDKNAKLSMVEKHLVSPEMAEKSAPSAIVENDEQQLYILLCEEDHIRIQSIRAGLDLDGAFEAACKADDLLDEKLNIAFDEKLGYITHCPTNLGTGMRASVMMFLPALTMTGRIRTLQNQISKLGLCVRGMTGEGSAAKGCLYQFSNCATQGVTEEEIIENLKSATEKIAESEKSTRTEILEKYGDSLRDRVMRALGTMKYAYTMNSEELFRLYADARLGICLGIISGVSAGQLDRALTECLPATLMAEAGHDMSAAERDRARAEKLKKLAE